jgi:hypothetical protein
VFHNPLRRGGPAPTTADIDRRGSERFAPAQDQAWIGWWEGRVYRKSRATLLDISQGGARAVAEASPPRRATVWICLDGPNRTEWVEAEVLEVRRMPDGSALVRMAFRELCPYTFFEATLNGLP